mmetsp:Transcript_16356/g.28042  ORF Transcript_16356/g.28042 Transcript_16356/m.28042 type:complete len:336 (+) Transcript_16356:1-1008(+)
MIFTLDGPRDTTTTNRAMATISSSSLPQPRVMSIQSHVVHGNVGNKCAVFPLMLLGFEVDPIYSVQFSNHTGYPKFTGTVFDGVHLQSLLRGLVDNGLLPGYTHLLTGYIGSVTMLEAIVGVVEKVKEANQGQLTYVCDPVMGDEGKLYCPPEMVDAYRSKLLPLACVMVPNAYEAELLAECGPISCLKEGLAACDTLHQLGPHTVVITSISLPGDTAYITLLASTTQPQLAGPAAQKLSLRIPRIPAYFTGTGDLMAALLLAWLHLYPGDLQTAVERTVAGLQAVLEATAEACGPAALNADRTAAVCAARELRLVQNQHHLVKPPIKLHCERLG